MTSYKICSKIGEGSYADIYKAIPLRSDCNYVAVKCLKKVDQCICIENQYNEAICLQKVQRHPNILELLDVFIDSRTKRFCIVTELMTLNLFEFMQTLSDEPPSETLIRWLIYQILCALQHLKQLGYFHRDIKPENLLLKNDTLKVGDFGSCKNWNLKQPYTTYVATRWYRAPECCKKSGYYSSEMDIWSVGCIMYELLALKPLFAGNSEFDQLHCINSILGSNKSGDLKKNISIFRKLLPNASYVYIHLLSSLLLYPNQQRASVEATLTHPFFSSLRNPLYNYNFQQNYKMCDNYNCDCLFFKSSKSFTSKFDFATATSKTTDNSQIANNSHRRVASQPLKCTYKLFFSIKNTRQLEKTCRLTAHNCKNDQLLVPTYNSLQSVISKLELPFHNQTFETLQGIKTIK